MSLARKCRSALYYLALPFWNASFLQKQAVTTRSVPRTPCDITFITIAFNNVDVLILQCELMRRFVTNSFTHIIVDNSPSQQARQGIEAVCQKYGADYYALPQNPWTGKHNSRSHGLALNWACRNILHRYTSHVVSVLDHDVFPTKPHNLLQRMQGKQFMGVLQQRPGLWYAWPGFFFWKSGALSTKQLNFLPTRKADTGGTFGILF